MKQEVAIVTPLHQKTKRDYVGRVTQYDKGECAEVARKFGYDYWDGDRRYGYGGYKYDGRWEAVARRFIERYGLTDRSSILDIGCGKGFLLHELKKLLPGATVRGIDISSYAIENSKEEVRKYLSVGNCNRLPFADGEFDFVYTITTFHNLYIYDLFASLKEAQRVSTRGDGYLCVESYRNEKEKANLLYWQLTCESFFRPEEWTWIFGQCGYTGDYEFIYFE